MEELDNKTIICSVLFMDIVDYTQKTVSGQISLKEGFNVFLSIALKDIPAEDRIILDTGDGAAISFLGDIEDAFKVGLSMRESLLREGAYMTPPLFLRMGINLGPVRLIKDIYEQPNIVGDGVNVAQRVMGFADVGQLLVSRSYYDAVSKISQDYAGIFHYQGSRTDKHVREHEVYAIGYPGDFTFAKNNNKFAIPLKYKKIAAELMQVISRGSAVAYKRFRHATNKQLIAFVAAPLLGVLLVGLSLAVWKSEKVEPVRSLSAPPLLEARRAASSPAALPAKKTEPSPAAAPVEVVALSSPEASAAGLPKTEAPPPVKELAKSDAAIKAPDKPNIAKVRTLEETTGEAAVMRLVVVPWGEVYLDGRLQGVSPPLIELQVAPGEHVIEIWNTNFPPYKQTIQVKVGEKFKIKHKFGH